MKQKFKSIPEIFLNSKFFYLGSGIKSLHIEPAELES